jgi:flagellum-specific peptidoglycan hydrolase FlgJ
MRDAKLSNNEYKYRDVLGTTDPESLIYQVRTRGYCTDPTYDKSIMAHIQKWDLTKYDNIDDDFNGIYIQI